MPTHPAQPRAHAAPPRGDGRVGVARPHVRLVHNPESITPPAGRPVTAARVMTPAPAGSGTGPQAERVRPGLTQREIQVLRTWLLTDSKIVVAQELSISIGTVNTHLTRIRAKYTAVDRSARTKAALAARAIQDGLLSLDEL